MKIALISLDQFNKDRIANYKRCQQLVRISKTCGCEVAIFPEMTLTGYSLDVTSVSEPAGQSESLEWFDALSKEEGMHLIFGACLLNETSRQSQNVFCSADPVRGVKQIYAKVHPFSFVGEEKVFTAGEGMGFVNLPEIRIGASICYDLRFPELYSAMANQCQGAICIANWPAKRVNHWRILLRARAIENQMFMIGVNRIGCDGSGHYYEKSSIAVTPEGLIIDPLFSAPELDIIEIDASHVQRYRNNFPTLKDKRFDLYQKWAHG